MAKIEILTATIGSGQSLSSVVDLGDRVLVGVQVPAAWTSAQLAFYASHDGTDFGRLRLPNTSVVTGGDIDANDYLSLHEYEGAFKGVRWLQIRSGNYVTPVNQGGTRTLYLITRSDTPVLSVSC